MVIRDDTNRHSRHLWQQRPQWHNWQHGTPPPLSLTTNVTTLTPPSTSSVDQQCRRANSDTTPYVKRRTWIRRFGRPRFQLYLPTLINTMYPWVYPHVGTPMGVFYLLLHHYLYPSTRTHVVTCGCVAGTGYPMGSGAVCALETWGFTCALA